MATLATYYTAAEARDRFMQCLAEMEPKSYKSLVTDEGLELTRHQLELRERDIRGHMNATFMTMEYVRKWQEFWSLRAVSYEGLEWLRIEGVALPDRALNARGRREFNREVAELFDQSIIPSWIEHRAMETLISVVQSGDGGKQGPSMFASGDFPILKIAWPPLGMISNDRSTVYDLTPLMTDALHWDASAESRADARLRIRKALDAAMSQTECQHRAKRVSIPDDSFTYLVMNQVQGLSHSKIARACDIDRTDVTKRVNDLAEYIGLVTNKGKSGRPKGSKDSRPRFRAP